VSDDYVAGHLEEALAHTGETDVHVRVDGGVVHIIGTVATGVRRDAIDALASGITDLEIRNEVTVLHCDAPIDREDIA
jgi:hypothetical protein